jgi:hypothetical protein
MHLFVALSTAFRIQRMLKGSSAALIEEEQRRRVRARVKANPCVRNSDASQNHPLFRRFDWIFLRLSCLKYQMRHSTALRPLSCELTAERGRQGCSGLLSLHLEWRNCMQSVLQPLYSGASHNSTLTKGQSDRKGGGSIRPVSIWMSDPCMRVLHFTHGR